MSIQTNQQLFDMFYECVIATPNHNALIFEDETYTYSELNNCINQLCSVVNNKLQEKHDNRSDHKILFICLPKSPLLVMSILSALKLNMAFHISDPQMPLERIKFSIQDIHPTMILTTQKMVKTLAIMNKIDYLDVSDFAPDKNKMMNGEYEAKNSQDLAYIVYTSGSTGIPKGVMVSHFNLINVLCFFKELLTFSSADRFLSVTAPTFDIFILEIILPLIAGGSCYLYGSSYSFDINYIVNYMLKIKPTVMQATPSLWWLLFSNEMPKFNNLTALCGGEAMPVPLAKKMSNCFKRVLNVYGPSETTIWSTYAEILSESEITIGKPIANTSYKIFDEDLKEVNNGEDGELYIGGHGVAIGYWNNTIETNKSFLVHEGIRLYKTGDRVKQNNDQNLTYIGRKDQQIKLYGSRVECSEIEKLIVEQGIIKRCHVRLVKNENEVVRLVAFCQKQDNSQEFLPSELDQINQHLSNYLNKNLIPSAFMIINNFKLTLNGKVDEDELRNYYNRFITKKDISNLTDNIMQEIYAIWQNVLDKSNIDLDADYISIGGHSVYIPQIVNEINKKFTTALTIRDFVENQSISKLTAFIKAKRTVYELED